jgi:succinyl-diaminopimelate desuccinylase
MQHTSEEAALIHLTQSLLRCQSTTPNEAGTLAIITDFCEQLGMTTRRYDYHHTSNLFATIGPSSPNLLFCGHVDVVPPGDLNRWTYPPFSAHIDNNQLLFGRGAVDMKSSIAAFLFALKKISPQNLHTGISLLITSDEEGSAEYGTTMALRALHQDGHTFDYALVGEPTSEQTVGDTIKIGRRGSLSATVTLHGQQGHVAYPDQAINPIPAACRIVDALSKMQIDPTPPQPFPASHCSFTGINSTSPAGNVSPGDCTWSLNFRYSPALDARSIQATVEDCIRLHWPHAYTGAWHNSAEPFLSHSGTFLEQCQQALQTCTGSSAAVTTSGGTSDARFVHQYVPEIVELGPLNSTAHKTDEHISLADLIQLHDIYSRILQGLTQKSPV